MWQTLETKARFIQQVMSGHTSIVPPRTSRPEPDLRRNQGDRLRQSAVMEKVKVDTEVRKLDQLRSVHLNSSTASVADSGPAGGDQAAGERMGS